MTKTWVIVVGAMICCTLWGSAFPCIKIGYRMMEIAAADTASQILYAGYRFTLAGVLTIVLGSILQRKILLPKRSAIGKIGFLSLLQTVLQYLFFYIGLRTRPVIKPQSSKRSVHLWRSCRGLLFHQETVTSRKMLGCLIGFAGVVLVNVAGSGMDFHFSPAGDGCILLSTVAYAFSSVCMKRFSQKEDPVMLSGYQFILGGIVMIACGAAMGGHLKAFTASAAALLIYMAMISAVAYSLWGMLLKYNPVSKVTVFGFMNPVIGVILSALLLNETESLGVSSVLALGLVCVGIYIVNAKDKD